MRKAAAAFAAGVAALAVSLSTLSASAASSHLTIGIYDEGVTLYGRPASVFPVYKSLHAQVLIISPCSGHGFKFATVIGEIIADLLAEGRSRFDLSLFRTRSI